MNATPRMAQSESERESRDGIVPRTEWDDVLEQGYRLALCLTGSSESAGELLEVSLRTFGGVRDGARGVGPLGPSFVWWLLTLNDARQLWAAPPSTAAGRLDGTLSGVISMVHELPPDVRAVTALFCAAGQSAKEVAAVLGTSRTLVRRRLRQGGRLLRERLAGTDARGVSEPARAG